MGNWIYIVIAVFFGLIGWARGFLRTWKSFLALVPAVLTGLWCGPRLLSPFLENLPETLVPFRMMLAVLSPALILFIVGLLLGRILSGPRNPADPGPAFPAWSTVLGGLGLGAATGLLLASFLFFLPVLTPLRFLLRDPGWVAVERRAAAQLIVASPYRGKNDKEAAEYLKKLIADVDMPKEVNQKILSNREERYQKEEAQAKEEGRPWRRPAEEPPVEEPSREFHSIWDGAYFIPAIDDWDTWKDEMPASEQPAETDAPAPEQKADAADAPSDGAPKGSFFQRIRSRVNASTDQANSAIDAAAR